jgi:hypothetical protein
MQEGSIHIAAAAAILIAGSNMVPVALVTLTVADLSDPQRGSLELELSAALSNAEQNAHATLTDGRRRVQESYLRRLQKTLGVSFQAIDPGLALSNLNQQLTDPSSALMSGMGQHIAGMTFSFECAVGMLRTEGTMFCERCPYPQYLDGTFGVCMKCPNGQDANDIGDGCVCQPHYYNTTLGKMKCHTTDFSTPDPKGDLDCEPCSNFDCVADCHGNDLDITPGWSVIARKEYVTVLGCKVEDACPAASFVEGQAVNCTQGYRGKLCGECDENYEAKADGTCTACKTFSTEMKVAVVFGILLVIFLAVNLGKWIRYFDAAVAVLELINELELKAIGKIMVSALQILGNLAAVLGVTFPESFVAFLSTFTFAVSFDITATFSFGCVMEGQGFYLSSLSTNIGMVILVCVLVWLNFFWGSIKVHRELTAEALEQVMREFFTKVDRDGDGIEMHELRKLVLQLDSDTSIELIDEAFIAADTDAGGTITFDEFYAALGHTRPDDLSDSFDEGVEFGNPVMQDDQLNPRRTSASIETEKRDGDGDASPLGKSSGLDFNHIVTKSRQASVKASAMGRVFLLVFLLYPALTNKIFEGFACRDLGHGVEVLDVDYTIDCESEWYVWQLRPACAMLLLLWPIGLPSLLFWLMWSARERIMDDDHDTLMEFDFVIGDYKKKYYYWEVVSTVACAMQCNLSYTRVLTHICAGRVEPEAYAIRHTWLRRQGLSLSERGWHTDLFRLFCVEFQPPSVQFAIAERHQNIFGIFCFHSAAGFDRSADQRQRLQP